MHDSCPLSCTDPNHVTLLMLSLPSCTCAHLLSSLPSPLSIPILLTDFPLSYSTFNSLLAQLKSQMPTPYGLPDPSTSSCQIYGIHNTLLVKHCSGLQMPGLLISYGVGSTLPFVYVLSSSPFL